MNLRVRLFFLWKEIEVLRRTFLYLKLVWWLFLRSRFFLLDKFFPKHVLQHVSICSSFTRVCRFNLTCRHMRRRPRKQANMFNMIKARIDGCVHFFFNVGLATESIIVLHRVLSHLHRSPSMNSWISVDDGFHHLWSITSISYEMDLKLSNTTKIFLYSMLSCKQLSSYATLLHLPSSSSTCRQHWHSMV